MRFWMYSVPATLDAYADDARLPTSQIASIRASYRAREISPDHVAGGEEVVAAAVKLRFLPAPLSRAQIDDLMRLPAGAR